MRKTAVITGSRAEYGILKPVIEKIATSDTLELCLIVTGMHLSAHHGMTVHEIERDGFPIAAKVDMQLSSESGAAMAISTGIGIQELTKTLAQEKPDTALVLGDRIEAMAGAIAGLFCGCTLAHIHGGDVTQGGLDEYMRHAITKLSHIHFAATPKSRERIIRLGEAEEFVYQTGTPGLDAILKYHALSISDLEKKLEITLPASFAVVVQHPVSTQPETSSIEINATLSALKESDVFSILIYPNADAGSQNMMDIIKQYESEDWLQTYTSVPRDVYCSLLRFAAFLIGNSSSGMIDAPAYGTPVINIGERQAGRERGSNVLDVQPEKSALLHAIQICLHDDCFKETCRQTKNPYGDGKASERIVSVLESVDLDAAKAAKRLPW